MNIGEANAVNTVLRHFLYLGSDATTDQVRDAAVLLADKANKALDAGLRGRDIELASDRAWKR